MIPDPRSSVARRRVAWLPLFPALALALLAAASCGRESGPTLEDAAAAKDAVDTLWTHYALATNAHDAAAFDSLFTENAALVFSDAPTAHGLDAIKKTLATLYAPVSTTALRIQQEEFRMGGAMAFQGGTFEEDFIEGGKEKTEYGRFSLLAERGDDKRWRILRLTALADSTK